MVPSALLQREGGFFLFWVPGLCNSRCSITIQIHNTSARVVLICCATTKICHDNEHLAAQGQFRGDNTALRKWEGICCCVCAFGRQIPAKLGARTQICACMCVQHRTGASNSRIILLSLQNAPLQNRTRAPAIAVLIARGQVAMTRKNFVVHPQSHRYIYIYIRQEEEGTAKHGATLMEADSENLASIDASLAPPEEQQLEQQAHEHHPQNQLKREQDDNTNDHVDKRQRIQNGIEKVVDAAAQHMHEDSLRDLEQQFAEATGSVSSGQSPTIPTHQHTDTHTESPRVPNEVIYRGGVSIPADSELLRSLSLPESIEPSPRMLVKANLASLPLSLQASDSLPIRIQFIVNTIPVLDNVATQILRIIGVAPYEETLAIITSNEPTPEGLVFGDLVKLFEQVKEIFSAEDPFLDMEHIVDDRSALSPGGLKSMKEMEDTLDAALKKSNLATFLLAALGAVEVGLSYLNESFLDVFCPTPSGNWFNGKMNSGSVTAGKLLKAQAGLFLELKTQTYIAGLEFSGRPKEELLDEIFPDNFQQLLLKRRQSTQLTPAESDFILRCASRRETLMNASDDEDLSESFEWLIFLKEVFGYVSKNIGFLLWGRKGRTSFLPSLTECTSSTTTIAANLTHLSKEEIQERLKAQKVKELELKELDRLDMERAARESHQKHQKQKTPTITTATSSSSPTSSPSINTTTKKSTTATATTTTTTGPPRIRTIMRRTWSREEEKALVEALKEHGPHWSKILDLYGAGGKVNESLKSRTQVQLKDKARNWKMSYLKHGSPIPDHLQKVTGELDRDDKAASARRRLKIQSMRKADQETQKDNPEPKKALVDGVVVMDNERL